MFTEYVDKINKTKKKGTGESFKKKLECTKGLSLTKITAGLMYMLEY